MAEQAWDDVTYIRKSKPKTGQLKTGQALSAAQRQGVAIETSRKCKYTHVLPYFQLLVGEALSAAQRAGVEIESNKKFGAASNKQHNVDKNTAKLDRETEELSHSHVTLDVGRLIQQGRQGKNLTQKELATRINEKPQVINDYESARAIPNQAVLAKIERVIGIKLRGKDKGTPLGGPKKK